MVVVVDPVFPPADVVVEDEADVVDVDATDEESVGRQEQAVEIRETVSLQAAAKVGSGAVYTPEVKAEQKA